MKIDITTSPVFVMTCFRGLSLLNFDTPSSFNGVSEDLIDNYVKYIYTDAPKNLIRTYTEDPNNRLEVSSSGIYVHGAKGELPELMGILFAASKNKNTLRSIEKYLSIADVLPFEYSLFCLHVLLITAYKDESIQETIPMQLYNINDIQALRFLDRAITVLRLNMFVSISTLDIPPSVNRAFSEA